MSSTRINVRAVIELSPEAVSALRLVSAVKCSVSGIQNQIDGRIMSRNNLSGRLQNISSQLSTVEGRIKGIKETVEDGANSFYKTDSQVASWGRELNGRIARFGAKMLLGANIGKQFVQKTNINEAKAQL